jgi:hypothetical protein
MPAQSECISLTVLRRTSLETLSKVWVLQSNSNRLTFSGMSEEPSKTLSVESLMMPSVEPSKAPSVEPSMAPSVEPSKAPSIEPPMAPPVQPLNRTLPSSCQNVQIKFHSLNRLADTKAASPRREMFRSGGTLPKEVCLTSRQQF